MADIGTGGALFQIIVSDLVLSGDNALVIGMAVQKLRGPLRRRAVLLGTAGAVILRIIFTIFAFLLLQVPLLSAIGGALLFWIGYRLLVDGGGEEAHSAGEVREDFVGAVRTIIIADAVMSLDNALAVAGAAGESVALLLIGLALSIPLLFLGANVVSGLFNRFPALLYIGAAVVAYTGAHLIHQDRFLNTLIPALHDQAWTLPVMGVVAVVAVLGLGFLGQTRARRQDAAKELERAGTGGA